MSNRVIVDTIRKLLRVAKTVRGHEGNLARARAYELMDKHKVTVVIREIRKPVKHVIGVPWRTILLVSIGRNYSCKVVLGDKLAVVAGESIDVDETVRVYEKMAFDMVLAAYKNWEPSRWAQVDHWDYDYDEAPDGLRPPEEVEAIRKAFGDAFLLEAANTVADRLGLPKQKKDPPPPTATYPAGFAPKKPKPQPIKIDVIIGKQESSFLKMTARTLGESFGLTFGLDAPNLQRRLMMKSTFPPPLPPDRFTYLEID
jgi:hypothetical protein